MRCRAWEQSEGEIWGGRLGWSEGWFAVGG